MRLLPLIVVLGVEVCAMNFMELMKLKEEQKNTPQTRTDDPNRKQSLSQFLLNKSLNINPRC